MLEAPREVPPEVDEELAKLDYDVMVKSARFGVFAALAFLAFFPLLYYVGFRDLWYMLLGPAICLVVVAAELYVAPRNAYLSGYITLGGNLLLFALFAWLV